MCRNNRQKPTSTLAKADLKMAKADLKMAKAD
jgi:hypothetical protein